MHARDLSLDETMTAKIATLHQALARLPMDKSAPAAGRPTALLDQADRLLAQLTDWLLDDEQRQVIGAQPITRFCLHAAACLCDIGLMDAFTVDHVGSHPYFPATIQVRIRCRDAELHRALKHYERVVVARLNRLNQHVRPRFLFSDVIFEIEPGGYQPVDLKFSVDTSAALQLFMDNRLYSDKRVFLRELIQNAVDACSLRKLADDAYSPAIAIAFNHDISQITISDNGIGMDRQWLENTFWPSFSILARWTMPCTNACANRCKR